MSNPIHSMEPTATTVDGQTVTRIPLRDEPVIEPFIPFGDVGDPHRRVKLTAVGEDGNFLVAMGHIDGGIFLPLAVAYIVDLCGLSAVDWITEDFIEWDDIVGLVEHRWGIYKLTEYGDTWLHWGDVTEETEGAFRITIFDQEF